jgi:hypothetical protein
MLASPRRVSGLQGRSVEQCGWGLSLCGADAQQHNQRTDAVQTGGVARQRLTDYEAGRGWCGCKMKGRLPAKTLVPKASTASVKDELVCRPCTTPSTLPTPVCWLRQRPEIIEHGLHAGSFQYKPQARGQRVLLSFSNTPSPVSPNQAHTPASSSEPPGLTVTPD